MRGRRWRRSDQFLSRYAALTRDGVDLNRVDLAIALLVSNEPMPPGFGDHPLKGKLHGWRSCVVAILDEVDRDNRPITVVMVYYEEARRVYGVTVDRHDDAYQRARRMRAARRR